MASRTPSGMSAGKIILIVVGSLGLILGLALAAGGGLVLVAPRLREPHHPLPPSRIITGSYEGNERTASGR